MKALLVDRVLPAFDWCGRVLAGVAMAMIVLLVVAMLYEVVARKFFNAPTMWAITTSYMFNGTLFLMGAAFTLRMNAHVRIDFLSARLPARIQHAVNLLFYAVIFLPALGLSSYYSTDKAWKAYLDGTLETMSAWEPVIWPFLTGIAIGIVSFTLQVLLEAVRHAIGLFDPDLIPTPSGTGAETA